MIDTRRPLVLTDAGAKVDVAGYAMSWGPDASS
jgi:hypothetical protein